MKNSEKLKKDNEELYQETRFELSAKPHLKEAFEKMDEKQYDLVKTFSRADFLHRLEQINDYQNMVKENIITTSVSVPHWYGARREK